MCKERDELLPFFNLVANKENWKKPIKAVVPPDANLDKIREAVRFFAGSITVITPQYTGRGKNRVLTGHKVTARGYYLDIGA